MYNFSSVDELKSFIASEVVNTAEATSILNCSRQYIDKLVKSGKLVPVKAMLKDKLFLKSEVLERLKK